MDILGRFWRAKRLDADTEAAAPTTVKATVEKRIMIVVRSW